MANPNLKLTYFDFHGGRGEAARIAMTAGGVKFEDHRFAMKDFGSIKREFPFGAVPVLHVNGEPVSQSVAILRYVGKLAKLYPNSDLEALYCDEILETVEDVTTRVVATFGIKDQDQMRAAREALVAGPFTTFLKGFEAILKRRGTGYFVGDNVSVADLSVFVWIKGLKSGNLDYVPKTIVETTSPTVNEHYNRIKSSSIVADYYKSKSVQLP